MTNIKVLRPQDLSTIISFEKKFAAGKTDDPMDVEFLSWSAPWRQESLEYYLPLGWSFGVWSGEGDSVQLEGYFLGQAILFMQHMTQTLWVEHLSFLNLETAKELVNLAYRSSREKHLQKVIFNNSDPYESVLNTYKINDQDDSVRQINTTRL